MLANLLSRLRPANRSGPPRAPGTFRHNPATLLVFLHIPKTAGTAVTDGLRAHFAPERIFPSYDEGDLAAGAPAKLRRAYDFAHVHTGANVAFAAGSHVFTVLRDPTARLLSLYNYWRSEPLDGATVFDGGLVDPAVTMARSMSFEEFVFAGHRRILADFENGQTFQLATSNTDQGRDAARGMTPDQLLDLACANLGRMGAIGVTEDLAQFAVRLERAYGLSMALEKRNVTQRRFVEAEALGSDVRARIEALTELDRTLYDRVRSGRIAAAA